jgi:hypothetical protein
MRPMSEAQAIAILKDRTATFTRASPETWRS